MTKLLLMSDVHGLWDVALSILNTEDYDQSIGLGDFEENEMLVKQHFDHYVGGNNDFGYSIEEKVIEIEGLRIAICHGHTRGIYVQPSFSNAIAFAKDMNAQIVLHGHSHILRHENSDKIDVICPGSINWPRTSHGPTYAILTLDNKKIVNLEFKKVK